MYKHFTIVNKIVPYILIFKIYLFTQWLTFDLQWVNIKLKDKI